MSGDYESIISQSLEESGLAERDDMGELVGSDGSASDDNPSPDESDDSPAPPADAAAPVEDAKDAPAKEEPPKEDELDAELREAGLPKPSGGNDPRMRWSRVRKSWDNYKTKYAKQLEEKHEQALTPVKQQLQQVTEQVSHYQAAENLLQTDPSRYFAMIAQVNPALKQFLNPQLFGEQAPTRHTEQTGEEDPRPKPDAKFPDGSMGYSDEGLQKLEAWNRRQAVAEAERRMEAKFGKPIQEITQQRRIETERQMHYQAVEQNVARATQIYGKLFTDDFGRLGAVNPNSEIMRVMQTQKMPFLEACAIALIPKVQGDRNRMREELIKELDTAGKNRQVASRPAPASSQLPSRQGPQSTEEIIADEMRKNGLLV